MNNIISLLESVKLFLVENLNSKGAFSLLAKVDECLTQLSQNLNFLQSTLTKTQMMSENNQLQLNLPVNKLNSQVQLIDMFIIEYDFEQQDYYVINSNQNSHIQNLPNVKQEDLTGDHIAIKDLLLSKHLFSHVQMKQKTQSMTELHKLMSNLPHMSPVILMPNYSGQNQKYFYIYETKQCLQKDKQYFLIDRYYVFTTFGLALISIDTIFKNVRKKVFQKRLLLTDKPSSVNHKLIKGMMQSTFQQLYQNATQFTLTKTTTTTFPECTLNFIDIKIKTGFFSSSKLISLAILLFYGCVSQYKIALFVSIQKRQYLTQAILMIETFLSPYSYVYPVVFSRLSKQHLQYMESPVPMLIGYWGKKSSNQKYINKLQDPDSDKLASIPQMIINLDNLTIPGVCKSLKTQDLYILQKISSYINKKKSNKYVSEQLSLLMRRLMNDNPEKQRSQWMNLLAQKIKNSQIYQVYNSK